MELKTQKLISLQILKKIKIQKRETLRSKKNLLHIKRKKQKKNRRPRIN